MEQLRKENDQLRMRLATTTLESLDTITTAPEDEALTLFHQLRAAGYTKAPVSEPAYVCPSRRAAPQNIVGLSTYLYNTLWPRRA